MADESVLSDEFLRQLINVGGVDLLVAVPTHNHAKAIGQVVQAVRLALLKYFPRERAVVVNADGGSRDGTAELALQAAATLPADVSLQSLRTFHVVTATYGNGMGASSPIRMLLAAADLLQAKACAVVSPSGNVTPQWIERLLVPVYRKDFDFVAPLYRRHKSDGLLIRSLLYPMIRALYGKRIREPCASDFGFSGRLGADLVSKNELWDAEAGKIGDELLLSLSAAVYGYRVCETFLGPREQSERPADLVPAVQQTVRTLFRSLDSNAARWQATNGSEAVPVEYGDAEITCEPLRINRKRLHQMFQSGVADLQSVLSSILSQKTMADLTSSAALGEAEFCFPDELWARAVYEFAASYHKAVISRDHIIQALVPLYRGQVFEFLQQHRQASPQEVEAAIEALCITFERLKPSLVELWTGDGGGTS